MKLSYNKNSKDPIYYIQQGYRIGKKTTTRNVKTIGKHSELLKITDDPLEYARQQVAKYNEEAKSAQVNLEVSIDFEETLKESNNLASSSTLLNIGYFYIQALYNQLGIGDFFADVAQNRKITFDPNLVNRFLTYDRLISPQSKLGTCRSLDTYYEQPDFQYQHILRTMDLMAEHYDEYISHLFEASNKVVNRDTSVCYFDCTNFYFEVESPDDDYIDPVTGEFIKGFRKYGMSKQHQPTPLVEMGLFMDSQGIPISMCITSGSDNEQTLAIPLEKKMSRMFKGRKFIYCADAGLGSLDIRRFNSMGGRSFIVTQSIKKLSKQLQEAVFNDCDYRLLSSDAPFSLEGMQAFDKSDKKNERLYNDRLYKIIPVDRLVDLGFTEERKLANGTSKQVKAKGMLKQNLIVTFSRKTMEYQRFIRNRQVERARALLKNLDPETYKKGPNDVTRFIKRQTKATKKEYVLDEEKIMEEEKYDGFYAVATDLEDPATEILKVVSQRYKIEENFRILKTDFSGRPVWHRDRDRIIAHFMICYTALLIYRLLEVKLEKYCEDYDHRCQIDHSDRKSRTHFTTDMIISTLQNMNVANMQDLCYMSIYTGSKLCTALNSIFKLGLDKKYYKPKDLNKKIKKILK